MEASTAGEATSRPETHRACANCARAKAKCVLGDQPSGACQRCYRLQKLCEVNPARPKAQPRKRKPLESTRIAKYRVQKLEEKLDDLVSLLKSGQENAPSVLVSPPETIAAPVSNASIEYSLPSTNKSPVDNSDFYQAESWDRRLHNVGNVHDRFAIPHDVAFPKTPVNKIDTLPAYDFGKIDVGTENPDTLLNIFRNEMHPNFPFIVIPDSISASELRQNWPTLYTAVMAVATRHSGQQARLGKQIIQQVADRVIVRGERNLDLLQGVLTYAGWCYFNFYNVPRFTSLINMATTLIADLRLNSQTDANAPGHFVCAVHRASGQDVPKEKAKTLEERRIFLGYWYLTSVISGFFRRLDKPIWSAYGEECCQSLDLSNAHRDDMTAVKLVRIQLLGDKILQSPWHTKQDAIVSGAPPILYLNSLQADLKDLKERLSYELEKNDAVLLSYQGIDVLLHKIGLSKSPALDSFSGRDFNRIEFLYACQQAVKRFFDLYLAVDVRRYHCWSVHTFMLVTWNLGILQLLSTFEHPDWNPEWAQTTLSFTEVLALLAERYGKAKNALGFDPHTDAEEDIFSNTARKMLWIKSFFEGRNCGPSGIVETDSVEAPIIEMPDFMQGAEFVDLLDDQWMQEFLGSWE